MTRQYTKYDLEYQKSPEQVANRVARNKARRQLMAEGKVSKGDGKEVDHKKPLSKGGSNSRSNLQVLSRSANRAKK